MASRKGKWNTPPCPLCVRWTCSACGHPKANPVNRLSWRSFPVIKCNACGSTEGTTQAVHHYYGSTHARHVEIHRKKTQPLFNDPSEIVELEHFAVQLAVLIDEFQRAERAKRRTKPGTPERLLARNTGYEKLREIEGFARRWVRSHPERKLP